MPLAAERLNNEPGERYRRAFARLRAAGEGAFCPFLVIGDPDIAASERLIEAAIAGGADMLELGIPFSDPVADGPTIQAAAERALAAGATVQACLDLIGRVRARHPELPIGVLTYANLVVSRGLGAFYRACAEAGLDSVLVADVPALEAEPFAAAARDHGIAPVLIAAPNTPGPALERIARLSAGYVYCVARGGVTGAGEQVRLDHARLFDRLIALNAPPPMLGFGISTPEHVRTALAEGAAGAISGSAVVSAAATHLNDPATAGGAVEAFVRGMKAATAA
ncbi:MAG TPA: tryptophan synthase subunit alpha [Caulobacteraceae bacterium]